MICACGKPGKRCLGCSQAWYCSRRCQRTAWTEHKLVCGRRGLEISAWTPFQVLDDLIMGKPERFDMRVASGPDVVNAIIHLLASNFDFTTMDVFRIADTGSHPDSVRLIAVQIHERWMRKDPYTTITSEKVQAPQEELGSRRNNRTRVTFSCKEEFDSLRHVDVLFSQLTSTTMSPSQIKLFQSGVCRVNTTIIFLMHCPELRQTCCNLMEPGSTL